MLRKVDNALSGLKRWCERQADREAPYMPLTAIASAAFCPIFTAIQERIDSGPKDSSWPFCFFLTGLFLHLAVGWGFEYQAKWKYNRIIGEAAIIGCIAFWTAFVLYVQ